MLCGLWWCVGEEKGQGCAEGSLVSVGRTGCWNQSQFPKPSFKNHSSKLCSLLLDAPVFSKPHHPCLFWQMACSPPPLPTEVVTPKPPPMVPCLAPVSAGLAARPAKEQGWERSADLSGLNSYYVALDWLTSPEVHVLTAYSTAANINDLRTGRSISTNQINTSSGTQTLCSNTSCMLSPEDHNNCSRAITI